MAKSDKKATVKSATKVPKSSKEILAEAVGPLVYPMCSLLILSFAEGCCKGCSCQGDQEGREKARKG